MKKLTKDQQKTQEELLKNGSGWACYLFAKYIQEADIKALEKRAKELNFYF